MATPPSFDEWVEYCFTLGHADFAGETGDTDEVSDERQERFLCMDPSVLTEYLTRLFEAPAFIADRYTDDQIAKATWFLFGVASQYFHVVRSDGVPPELQVRCIRSIATMYTDLFDRVCGRHGDDPDADLRETVKLDCAVYMIWDMDCLGGMVMFPEKGPHLVEHGIFVLEAVLERCLTSACLTSTLHGIGHIYSIHNYNGDPLIAQRMQSLVDAFLERRRPPDWLREYAEQARQGAVQ